MDITDELRGLIQKRIKPGQYMLTDHQTLEDTLSAIDIGNPKMDRGMVQIEGLQLLDFVDRYFEELPGKEIDVTELLRTLFRLEMTWYTGKAYFSDTLLTCILLHREPSVIIQCTGNKLAALALEATMTAASLVSYLIASSPVIREEDFHANLYGMNWWTCTYAGTHFPRPSKPSEPNIDSFGATVGEVRLNLLLEQLASICRDDPNSPNRFYFARLYHWIKFLNEYIKSTSVVKSTTSSGYSLILELQSVCSSGIGDEDELMESQGVRFIYSDLANLFGCGCVRPYRPVLSLNAAIRAWNRGLKDDLDGFLGRELLLPRPRLMQLLKKLSERSRDPLKPPILPVIRSIIYAGLVQNRFETIYEGAELRDEFVTTSLPASVSLGQLADLPLLLQDFIQVYCSNVARQRRSLPDLLLFWDDRILGRNDLRDLAGYRTVCWLRHFRDLVAMDLVFLYGHLKLLSEPWEVLQAVQMISAIFDRFKVDGGKDSMIPSPFSSESLHITVAAPQDRARWLQRWKLMTKTAVPTNPGQISTLALNWYRRMIQLGRSSWSLDEPDWMCESFCTPMVGSRKLTLFTMYTTEYDEPEEESDEG